MLARAALYVGQFIDRFSNVVAEERFVQDATGNLAPLITGRGTPTATPSSQHRVLRSDFLLVQLSPGDWLPFRDVFEVDGKAIRDREDRLAKLFLGSPASPSAIEQGNKIAAESARYNVGGVQRTINTPLLSLLYLQAGLQPRFKFELGKRDTSAGENVWIVEYTEVSRPTLVRGVGDSDVPSSGRFWIEAESGRIIKTELNLITAGIRAHLTTSYRKDDRFQVDVPVEMQEDYTYPRGRLSGTATYGRFRRFDVSADESIRTPMALDTITDRRTGTKLFEIPSGRFTMGSPTSELDRGDDETLHDVTLDHSFFLAEREVTQQDWQAVMGKASPSRFSTCGPRCPVENVTYADVQQFLATLNGLPDNELLYRLPTEAEWEYACRAGTITPFWTGDTLTTAQANYDGRNAYGTTPPGLFRERPVPAAGFAPNRWGLADMHGNVSEWTEDWYGPYPETDVVDPHGAPPGDRRVTRGGSWQASAPGVRCAFRAGVDPATRNGGLGFRIAAERIKSRD
jgi:formylglycine-generating enzyme required for sulfatase activity